MDVFILIKYISVILKAIIDHNALSIIRIKTLILLMYHNVYKIINAYYY